MSILIRGMDMPTGRPMWIVVHSDGTVETNDVGTTGWLALRNAAIPIPPHGRLIDADVLCERLMKAWHTADSEGRRIIGEVMADVVTPIVVGTPTVIEAEAD